MRQPPGGISVPDLFLERYRLGELPDEERSWVEGRLAADPILRHRLEALSASEVEVDRLHPAASMVKRIRDRARVAEALPAVPGRAWGLRPRLAAGLAVAAVAVAVGLTLPRFRSPADGVRLKGSGAELVVFRKTAAGSERLEPGAVAHPGDLVRCGYRAAGRPYGAILSTDGRGNVTQHLPRRGDRAVALEAGGTVLLDFAYELDAAPRWERFYLVTGDGAFDLTSVRRAAREVAASGTEAAPPRLRLEPGLEQSVFTLTKEPSP